MRLDQITFVKTTYPFTERGDGGVKEEKLDNMQALMVNGALRELTSSDGSSTCL